MLPNLNFITFDSINQKKFNRFKNDNYRTPNLVFQELVVGVHKKYKNKNLYESLSAYGVGFHRHNSEIEQELELYTKKKINFIFTPHLSPMFRGILSTIYINVKKGVNIKNIQKVLKYFIRTNPLLKFLKLILLLVLMMLLILIIVFYQYVKQSIKTSL